MAESLEGALEASLEEMPAIEIARGPGGGQGIVHFGATERILHAASDLKWALVVFSL